MKGGIIENNKRDCDVPDWFHPSHYWRTQRQARWTGPQWSWCCRERKGRTQADRQRVLLPLHTLPGPLCFTPHPSAQEALWGRHTAFTKWEALLSKNRVPFLVLHASDFFFLQMTVEWRRTAWWRRILLTPTASGASKPSREKKRKRNIRKLWLSKMGCVTSSEREDWDGQTSLRWYRWDWHERLIFRLWSVRSLLERLLIHQSHSWLSTHKAAPTSDWESLVRQNENGRVEKLHFPANSSLAI